MADVCLAPGNRLARLAALFAAVASFAWPAARVAAQNAVAESGLYLTVPNPITSDAVTRIADRVKRARAQTPSPATIVFDFNPNDKEASTADFAASYNLAKFISQQNGTTTVAYVHDKVSGHAVLPALVCQQMVVGPKGKLGEVVAPNEPALAGLEANAYADLVGNARPGFAEVAHKMHDKGVQLRRANKGTAVWFADAARPAPGVVVSDTAQIPGASDGKVALFDAGQLRNLNLAQRVVENRPELLEAFRLPASVLRPDPLDRAPVAYRYTLRGPIDTGVKESVGRIVTDAVRNNATVFVLQLEASGGDPQAARELAERLIELQQGEQGIRIVAFVPNTAPDTAAIVALGCTEIIMSKRQDAGEGATEAEFGDFDTAAGKAMRAENLEFWVNSLRDLAEKQGYPPLLIEGMIRPELDIVRVHKKSDPRQVRFMTAAELEQGGKDEWVQEKAVKARGRLLKLTATEAEGYGLARFSVANRDQKEVYEKLGLDPAKVKDATPGWLDLFANFLKNPVVTALLVVIGFTGLILELKVPGTTVPGIVAALCFILVFWAHTQFSGQVAVLAGLLFVTGFVLILLEVFVLPGFGVSGVVGIGLMLAALGLATVGTTDGQLPSTNAEWTRLGGKMGQYLFGMIGAVFLAFTIARYLPNIPYANRMMLIPPSDLPADPADGNVLPGAAQAASLLGAVGISVTVLRPAGSVRFGDDFVDVVTDGGYVPAGSRVQVIEVEGNRIVVKEV